MANAPSELWLGPGGQASQFEPCHLLNLSFGGMCFSSSQSLEQEKTYPFRIKLADLDPVPFAVKAEIRWSRQQQGAGWVMGASFQESTKGWVGPDSSAGAS